MINNNNAVIIKGLSKRYRIGVDETEPDTLVGKLLSLIKKPITNYKKLLNLSRFTKSEDDESVIWALNKINIEIKSGEVLGIIGPNGAGKSTLLKVLSRITNLTDGSVDLYGRVASLLEVGTGFHPELTGKENIYLNGTILGMSKKEVDIKYNDIVEFSGIQKFIHTPVKRYSSGMRVRLAFSVAAFLEPEILLVDEVLAVGDISFQKKCLGKMKNITSSGRTVIFVSHQMGAIKTLCNRVIVLNKGEISYDGSPEVAIDHYAQLNRSTFETGIKLRDRTQRIGNGDLLFTDINILDANNQIRNIIETGMDIKIVMDYELKKSELKFVDLIVHFKDMVGDIVFGCYTRPLDNTIEKVKKGSKFILKIPKFPLKPGNYYVTIQAFSSGDRNDRIENAIEITIIDGNFFESGKSVGSDMGLINVMHSWGYIKP